MNEWPDRVAALPLGLGWLVLGVVVVLCSPFLLYQSWRLRCWVRG